MHTGSARHQLGVTFNMCPIRRLDESHLTGEAGEVDKCPHAAPLIYSGSKVGCHYCISHSYHTPYRPSYDGRYIVGVIG